MYRPFLFIIIFLILGIISTSIIKSNFIFFCLSVIFLIYLISSKNINKKKLLLGVLIFFLGAFYFKFWIQNEIGIIHRYIDKDNITIVGYICNSPDIRQSKAVYDIDVLYVEEKSAIKKASGKVRVSILLDKKSKIYNFGDVIKIKGRLKKPKGKRNFGGFNYRAYLFQKGITATMFSKKAKKLGVYPVNPVVKLAFSARTKTIQFFKMNLPKNISAILSGLVLGIKGEIPRDTLEGFKDTGIMHLLAVSGLHVGIIYKMLQELFYYLGLPRKLSLLFQGFIIIFYCCMSGLTPSVVRATIMIIIMILSNLTGRQYDSINSLCIAALIILVNNPLSLFSISFQLSFCAALGIILFYDFFRNPLSILPRFLSDSIAAGISAQILVLPFSAYYFNKISILGLISTPIVAPAASVALVLGFVASILSFCFLPLGKVLVEISGLIIMVIEKIVVFLSKCPFAYIIIPQVNPFLLFIYFVFLALSAKLILEKKDIKKLGYILLCVMIFVTIIFIIPKGNTVEVTFIDVGQGDSIFIRTDNNKTVLIDGGGISSYCSGTFDVGLDTVKPFLYAKGVRNIDIMVFTHFDVDHVQGLLSLMKEMNVNMILYGMPDDSKFYKEMVQITKNKQIKVINVGRGDKFQIGNVLFEVLHPSKEKSSYTSNDSSVVLKMTYGDITFLFTGDLEHAGEKEILNSYNNIHSDVLKLGHHGSRTSTSEEFLDMVEPKFAVVSAGKDNKFGHPAPEVLHLLKNKGIRILRTDIQGGITFKIRNKNVKIQTIIPKELCNE